MSSEYIVTQPAELRVLQEMTEDQIVNLQRAMAGA